MKWGRSPSIVLPGGGTPLGLYSLLKETAAHPCWETTHFYWSDERFVPSTHPDSNERQVRENLLQHLPVPPKNIHPFDTGFSGLEEAALANERRLFPRPPVFDVVLLGLGEDGHIASIFPGHPPERPGQKVLAVGNAPKSPTQRLSLSLGTLATASAVFLLVLGTRKKTALAQLLAQEPSLPAAQLIARRSSPTSVLSFVS